MSRFDRAALERSLTEAPFHRWLGLQLVAADENGVEVAMPWRDEFFAQEERRYLHGGVIAALVDLTADLAIAARFGRAVPTIDLRVDYHKATAGGELRAKGSVIKLGRTISTAEATVYDLQGALIASGRGAYLTAQK